MRRLVTLLTALVLAAPSVAAAQPGVTPPQDPDDEMPTGRAPNQPTYHYEQPRYAPLPPPVMPETKNEGTGVALALGATIAGYAMLGAAADSSNRGGNGGLAVAGLVTILIGPSAGHIYAGESGHAVKMSLLRTAGLVTLMAGVMKSLTGHIESDCIDCSNNHSSGSSDNATTLMLAGGITFVAATVYDIVDSAGAVRRRNAKSRMYMVAPMYAQTSSGNVPGVALSGRF